MPKVIQPQIGRFAMRCILIAMIFGSTTVWTAWMSGHALMQQIAACFALANGALLGFAVILAHLCRETYDMD